MKARRPPALDWSDYRADSHVHPRGSYAVEIVAYERRDSGWDVFVFEPPGSCPELEAGRVDDQHVFIERVGSASDVDRVARDIERRLGDAYHLEVYYRESGARRVIGQIQSHLARHGAHFVWVRAVGPDWELVIRRKDFPLASQLVASNVRA